MSGASKMRVMKRAAPCSAIHAAVRGECGVVPLDERAAAVVLEQHLVAEVAQHPDLAVLVGAEGGGGDEAEAAAGPPPSSR